ncbi:DUF6744 family protein [Saccharopolyspora sp. NPDC000359]|uniref:DUF6744 family protein n=1 Tax=Saccharopolyspora sp. NPDC000359 TaxID=3154251 RepID=UPI003316F3CF
MSAPDITTNNATFDGYLSQLADDDVALLGALVIYNVVDVDDVTVEDLRGDMDELELDPGYLPEPPRPIEAFEKATSAAKTSYPLGGHRRRNHTQTGQTVTLMMRPVVRDETRIVRHLVRELVDHGNEELSYEVEIARCEFTRATGHGTDPGDGEMTIEQVNTDCLTPAEHQVLNEIVQQITNEFESRRRYVSADRIRKLLRDYIERELAAVRIHNGVYFVHHQHLGVLAGLRELTQRCGAELTRVPLPDTSESREMVEGAFDAKIATDLKSLSRDLAREQADPKNYRVRALHKRFATIKTSLAQHQQQMDTQRTELADHLALLEQQMTSLLMSPEA